MDICSSHCASSHSERISSSKMWYTASPNETPASGPAKVGSRSLRSRRRSLRLPHPKNQVSYTVLGPVLSAASMMRCGSAGPLHPLRFRRSILWQKYYLSPLSFRHASMAGPGTPSLSQAEEASCLQFAHG
jgi:hypothetical protein